MNHYIALIDGTQRPRVTLPHGTAVGPGGIISGLTGAVSIWNGRPKPWCEAIIEVRSAQPWVGVKDEEKEVLWAKEEA